MLIQNLADPLKGKAGQLPLAHQEELLDVVLGVIGAFADALRAIDEARLYVVPDGPPRQLCERGDFVEGEGLWGVHDSNTIQLYCHFQLSRK